MIHLLALLVSRKDRSHAQFRGYWRNDHIPNVTRLYEAAGGGGAPMPDLLGYNQNPATDATARRGACGYDGVAEFWLESLSAVEQMLDSGRVAASVGDDPNFLAAPPEWTALREQVLRTVPEGAAARKVFRFLRRRAGVSRDAFRAILAADHARFAMDENGVLGYAQNMALDEACRFGAPRWDAVEVLYLAQDAALSMPPETAAALDAAEVLEVDEAVMRPLARR